MLIDVEISGNRDRNGIMKEAEKILNYQSIKIEIQRMWNVTAIVFPVIIWGDWNHTKITQTTPEQHIGKPGN
jgi:hypothetical protein